jgi:hypothetical protein
MLFSEKIFNFLYSFYPSYIRDTSYFSSLTASSSNTKPIVTSFKNLPPEILENLFSYLDPRSLCRCAQVDRKFQNLTYIHTQFFKQLHLLSLSKDVYGLFALEIPYQLKNNPNAFSLLTRALKTSLQFYVFMDALASLRLRGFVATEYNLLKLVGKDYRNIQKEEILDENVDSQFCITPLSAYEKAASPFQLETEERISFSLTQDAAKILCLFLQENTEINSLVLISQPNKQQQDKIASFEDVVLLLNQCFGDDCAKILAENIPRYRFKMFIIAGGFGDEGVRAIRKNLPDLLTTEAPVNPENIKVAGGKATQKEHLKTEEEKRQYFTNRYQRDPTSVSTRQDFCSMM